MNSRIPDLIDKIAKLEHQLAEETRKQQEHFKYQLEGTRVRFEAAVLQAHRKLRRAVIPWLLSSRVRNVLSVPFIYSMIVPLAFLDLTITLYQHVCFRLYDIRRVRRSDYVVMDRHQLAYLNHVEKLNCVYCGYGNGVVAYAREVIARTEQYWCPIKHARRVAGSHRRYDNFLGYGDGEGYKAELVRFRQQLQEEDTGK